MFVLGGERNGGGRHRRPPVADGVGTLAEPYTLSRGAPAECTEPSNTVPGDVVFAFKRMHVLRRRREKKEPSENLSPSPHDFTVELHRLTLGAGGRTSEMFSRPRGHPTGFPNKALQSSSGSINRLESDRGFWRIFVLTQ